jgi:hypothetical protein
MATTLPKNIKEREIYEHGKHTKATTIRISSTDVPVILEKNKYKTLHELTLHKLGVDERKESIYAKLGQIYEQYSIEYFERKYGINVMQTGAIKDKDHDWLVAESDGYCSDGYLIEIKNLFRKHIQEFIPADHYAQVQTALHVYDCQKTYYVQSIFKEHFTYEGYILDTDALFKKMHIDGDDESDHMFLCLHEFDVIIIERNDKWFTDNFPLIEDYYNNMLQIKKKSEKKRKASSIKKIDFENIAKSRYLENDDDGNTSKRQTRNSKNKKQKKRTHILPFYWQIENFDRFLNKKEWIGIKMLKSWFYNDPLMMWLNFHGRDLFNEKIDPVKEISTLGRDMYLNSRFRWVSAYMDQYSERFGENNVKRIATLSDSYLSTRNFHDTMQCMFDGVGFVFDAVLMDMEDKKMVTIDLLVRNDLVNKLCYYNKHIEKTIFDDDDDDDDEITESIFGDYYYVPIQMLYKKIYMRKDYSAGRYEYNTAVALWTLDILNKIQKTDINLETSYSINRYTQCVRYVEDKVIDDDDDDDDDNPFCNDDDEDYDDEEEQKKSKTKKVVKKKTRRLEVSLPGYYCLTKIVPTNVIIQKLKNATKWMEEIMSEGSETMELRNTEDWRLMPNLSVDQGFDYPWRQFKKDLGFRNKEITALFGCGFDLRNKMVADGIYNFSDPNFINNLNKYIKNTDKVELVQKFAYINTIKERNELNKQFTDNNEYTPKRIDDTYKDLLEFDDDEVEVFIDFETTYINIDYLKEISIFGTDKDEVNHNEKEFEDWHLKSLDNKVVFMIGIGWNWTQNMRKSRTQWEYKTFCVNSLTHIEEARIFHNMLDYLTYLHRTFGHDSDEKENLVLYHWSPAERREFDELINKYSKNFKMEYTWFDLHKFTNVIEFIVQDQTSFSIKSVANAMYNNELVDETWGHEDKDITNGNEASQWAKWIGQVTNHMEDHRVMKKIERYNEYDCKMMMHILYAMRKIYLKR